MSRRSRPLLGYLAAAALLLGSPADLPARASGAIGSHPPAARPQAFKLAPLLEHIARSAPSSTPFVEAHFSPLLTRALVVSGTLEYLGPADLVRHVERPYKERDEIRGNEVTVRRPGRRPEHFSLERAPAMRSLLASFTDLLGGRTAALERHFRLDLHGDAGAWMIGLTPRDAATHRRIRAITVSGNGLELRCFQTFQANGDVIVTLVSRAARVRVPARPDRAWFDAECHGTHVSARMP